jgi:hypothetical protein
MPSRRSRMRNDSMTLHRDRWICHERGVHTAFMAREVEGGRMRWVLVLLLLLASLPRPALPEPAGTLWLAQAGDVKPLAEILQTIGQRFPGHALDAELVQEGEPRYRVRWLGEDGKVRDITADARTGQIIDVR